MQEALCGGIHALGKLLHGFFGVAAGRVLKGIDQDPMLLEDVQIQRRFFCVQPEGDIPGRRACQMVKDELCALIYKHHVCRDAVGVGNLGKGIQVVGHAVGQLTSGRLHQPGHVSLALKLLIDREGFDQHRAGVGKAGVAAAIVDCGINRILPAAVFAQYKSEYRVKESVLGHVVLLAPAGKSAGSKGALHTEGTDRCAGFGRRVATRQAVGFAALEDPIIIRLSPGVFFAFAGSLLVQRKFITGIGFFLQRFPPVSPVGVPQEDGK